MSVSVRTVRLGAVGDGSVGKTSLFFAYTTDAFLTGYIPSTFDSSMRNIVVSDRAVMLQMWDTMGGEDFDRWLPDLKRHCPHAKIILVGTKIDLREDRDMLLRLSQRGKKPITMEEGEDKAKEIGAELYIECSSMTQKGVNQLFEEAVKCVLSKEKRGKKGKKCIIS
ncbi:hypothetical protein PROFUN_04043 [Planoprotostelium fungivorum]|uniref:Uncharacterized protein n=1 Tax=Planoprotostelium fungivorum TaxID=1890364 RepID=A0A2P6NW89_9EUKA|nr:hypothetical protein PROFUN_04043 [Planoprotostelium fungivorum]